MKISVVNFKKNQKVMNNKSIGNFIQRASVILLLSTVAVLNSSFKDTYTLNFNRLFLNESSSKKISNLLTLEYSITTFKAGSKLTDAGKINLVTFANPNGLKREAGNLFSNFGDAAGTEGSGPANKGDIIQGTLELSNVDLTQEFSDLILAQRAFQAGSRIITVSDSVMEEIVNLKR